jgi:hypothetical protein
MLKHFNNACPNLLYLLCLSQVMHNKFIKRVINLKKKIISLSLVVLSLIGVNVFAAESVSTNCSLKGWYTQGSDFYAEASTTAPSLGLNKIAVSVYSDGTGNNYRTIYKPGSRVTVTTSCTGSNAIRIFSDHIWSYPSGNEEITKSLYLD